jgi:hypothetical protein
VNNKSPLLTGFPSHILASARRSQQAFLRKERSALSTHCVNDFGLQFAPLLPPSLLAKLSSTRRERHFGNVTTFWAWLSEITDQNGSCSAALSRVQAGCSQRDLPVPSINTSAYAQARQRLPLAFMQGVHSHLRCLMSQRVRNEDLYHGM